MSRKSLSRRVSCLFMNFTRCSDRASETRQFGGTGENHGEEPSKKKLRTTVGQCRILIWLLPRMPTSPDYEIDWRELKRFRLKTHLGEVPGHNPGFNSGILLELSEGKLCGRSHWWISDISRLFRLCHSSRSVAIGSIAAAWRRVPGLAPQEMISRVQSGKRAFVPFDRSGRTMEGFGKGHKIGREALGLLPVQCMSRAGIDH